MDYLAPLEQLLERSRLMILDFSQIPADLPKAENIQRYFEMCNSQGVNPRLPENRQAFNNRMIDASGVRYLVSRYGEDRSAMLAGSSIAAEGRTLHLGIDIFSKDLEPVFAPCDGKIVRTGREPGPHTFGYYLILRPASNPGFYFFFGHLSHNLPAFGHVHAGQRIAQLGDYIGDENGGWSRHLHMQLLWALPPSDLLPIGYSTRQQFQANRQRYPDPSPLFPKWQISRS